VAPRVPNAQLLVAKLDLVDLDLHARSPCHLHGAWLHLVLPRELALCSQFLSKSSDSLPHLVLCVTHQ
jgi:hypothetical protein